MKQALPSWALRVVQIAVLCGIAWLLWRAVDWREALSLLQAADRWLLLAAVFVLTAQTVLSAVRWRVTARRLGIEMTLPDALREYYLSQVVNQSLPGGVVGDAGRAVRGRRQAGLLASGQAVLFERIAGQIGLFAVLVVGIVCTVVVPTGMIWPAWLIWPVAFGCLGVTGVGAILGFSARSNSALGRGVRGFVNSVLARDVLGIQAGLSLGTAACNVAAFALCAAALGVALPFLVAMTLVPLILFAMILPLSISGWGLREGAATVLFPLAGASMSEGLASSVAFGLVFLASVLPGLLLTWIRPNAPVFGRR